MFICSGATADNCRGHVNPHSVRLETTSAKLLLRKVFYFVFFWKSDFLSFFFFLKKWFSSKLLSFFSCTVFLYCWEKYIWRKTFNSSQKFLNPRSFFFLIVHVFSWYIGGLSYEYIRFESLILKWWLLDKQECVHSDFIYSHCNIVHASRCRFMFSLKLVYS